MNELCQIGRAQLVVIGLIHDVVPQTAWLTTVETEVMSQ